MLNTTELYLEKWVKIVNFVILALCNFKETKINFFNLMYKNMIRMQNSIYIFTKFNRKWCLNIK